MKLSVIFNPWRRIRELEAEVLELTDDRNVWKQNATLMVDRYYKIRDTAAQLRETLTLYRNS